MRIPVVERDVLSDKRRFRTKHEAGLVLASMESRVMNLHPAEAERLTDGSVIVRSPIRICAVSA